MPESDLDLLIRAARGAGQIALSYWRKSPTAWDKPGGAGPVTEADLAVHRHLEEVLRAARPGYGWLSEESPDDPARLKRRQVFVVDPIDGTRAFMAGETAFAQALAVIEDGQVTAGVVSLPAMGCLYAAAAGGPASLNGQALRVGTRAQPEGARLLTGKPALDPAHWQDGQPPGFQRAFRPSLAWRFCLVAEGAFDGVLSFRPAYEWDIAAGSLILAAAGGRASDASGGALVFNRPDPRARSLWGANPALHQALLDRRSGMKG